MSAFKLYYKIANKHKGTVIMYLAIMVLIVSLTFVQIDLSEEGAFSKGQIAIFDEDNTALTNHLKAYILKGNEEVIIERDEQIINDYFYEEKLDIVITIPKNFTKDFYQNPNEVRLATDESINVLINNGIKEKVNQYFRIWQQYLLLYDYDIDVVTEKSILKELDQLFESSVEFDYPETEITPFQKLVPSFQFLSYALVGTGIAVVALAYLIMDKTAVYRRNIVSGYSERKRIVGIFIAMFLAMIMIWLVGLAISAFFAGTAGFKHDYFPYLLISEFVQLLALTTLMFLIVQIVSKEEIISFLSTILSLFIAFSAGIFVPRDFLPDMFIKSSSIFPNYWHINNLLYVSEASLDLFEFDYWLKNIVVMLGLMFVYLIAGILIRSRKQQFNS